MYVFSFWGKPSGILMDDDLPIGNGDVHQFSLVLLAYHSDCSRSMGHALPGWHDDLDLGDPWFGRNIIYTFTYLYFFHIYELLSFHPRYY